MRPASKLKAAHANYGNPSARLEESLKARKKKALFCTKYWSFFHLLRRINESCGPGQKSVSLLCSFKAFILHDWAMFRTTRQIACKYYVLYHAWFATTQPCLAAEILHKCSPGYMVLICLCKIYKIPQMNNISKLPTSFRWPQTNWFHSVAIASLKTVTTKANLHRHWLNFFADSYQPHLRLGKTRPKNDFFYMYHFV